MRLVISAGIAGAFLLARGRPEGLALVETTPAGAWRSFIAAAICLPAFFALRVFGWADEVPANGILRPLAAELIGYVLGWTAFALASLPLAQAWGRLGLWPRFIAAWNWMNVVHYLLWIALALPPLLGLSGVLVQGVTLAGFGYALWLEWFIARHALGLSGLRATTIVILDLATGIFLSGLVQRLSMG